MKTGDLIFNRWKTDDAKKLLMNDGLSLYAIIFDILSCKFGAAFPVNTEDYSILVVNERQSVEMSIPIPRQLSLRQYTRIATFMRQFGISNYMYMRIG